MKPDARNLSVNMRGEDVKFLQKRRNKLGFSIEDKDGFFGKTMRRAVLDIQKKHGMKATGIVDEATDEVINTDAPEQQRFIVHGRVMRSDGAALAGVTIRVADWDRGGEDAPGTRDLLLSSGLKNHRGHREKRHSSVLSVDSVVDQLCNDYFSQKVSGTAKTQTDGLYEDES